MSFVKIILQTLWAVWSLPQLFNCKEATSTGKQVVWPCANKTLFKDIKICISSNFDMKYYSSHFSKPFATVKVTLSSQAINKQTVG